MIDHSFAETLNSHNFNHHETSTFGNNPGHLAEVKKEPQLNYFYYDEAGKPLLRSLSDIEREIIESALEIYDQNIPKVATYLEVSPSTIYRKKQSWQSVKKH